MTPKQQIQALLDQLPDSSSFLEIQNHLNSYGGRRQWPDHDQAVAPHRKGSSGQRSIGDCDNDGARAYQAWQRIVSI